MKNEKRAPLVIASVYAVLGALWIFASGRIVTLFAASPAEIARWEMYKGVMYVIFTSALLYWLVWSYLKKLIRVQRALEKENRECNIAQASLKESEEQFHNMFVKSSAVMYLVDPVTLGIFDANEAAREFYGYSEIQFKNLKVTDLNMLAEDELRRLINREMCREGCYLLLKHRLSDGSERDVEVYASVIRLTNREFYFIIVHDITGRKESENALRESEARFRSLVETTSDWIWEVDANDVFTYSSPKIRDFLGYEPHEVIGMTPFDLMPVPEAQEIRQLFQRYRDAAKPFSGLHNRNVHKDGRIVILQTSGVPVFDGNGRFTGYRGIDRDITEHKHLEEQLLHAQKMEAIGELAGGIAHDFNNILTAIIGYVYILQTRLNDENLAKYAEQINHSAQRAASLVGKLLAFSRKQIICPQPMNIIDTVQKSEKLLSRVIREDIEIRTILPEEELTVMGDEGQIEQVIMNLVTNARDAMPAGGVLTISAERFYLDKAFTDVRGFGSPGPYVRMSVIDTGVGMDEKTRERIFEPFFTTKEVGKGTGLGLAIVYGIVKQHKGYIEVFSEPEKGTSFDLYFPLVGKGGKNKSDPSLGMVAAGAGTILVGEDDPDTRLFIKTVLEEFGYSVIEAVDGTDVVEKFIEERDRIRLLVIDIIMPKRNGRDAYEEIRKIDPNVKTIFLSGYSSEIMENRLGVEEDFHFMTKPVVPWKLLEKIRDLLA